MKIRNIVTFSLTPNEKKNENKKKRCQCLSQKLENVMSQRKMWNRYIQWYCWIFNSECYTTRCEIETFRILMYIR